MHVKDLRTNTSTVQTKTYRPIFYLQTKITETFTAVQKGVLRDVQQAVERKKLATARDGMGRCPLHVAVLTENEDVVGYIVQTFPNTVKCRDHVSQTLINTKRK